MSRRYLLLLGAIVVVVVVAAGVVAGLTRDQSGPCALSHTRNLAGQDACEIKSAISATAAADVEVIDVDTFPDGLPPIRRVDEVDPVHLRRAAPPVGSGLSIQVGHTIYHAPQRSNPQDALALQLFPDARWIRTVYTDQEMPDITSDGFIGVDPDLLDTLNLPDPPVSKKAGRYIVEARGTPSDPSTRIGSWVVTVSHDKLSELDFNGDSGGGAKITYDKYGENITIDAPAPGSSTVPPSRPSGPPRLPARQRHGART